MNTRVVSGIAMLLILAVSAAAGPAQEESAAESGAGDSKTITYICGSWYEGFFENFQNQNGYDLIGKFEEDTGITVNVDLLPFLELMQIIDVRLQAKSDTIDVISVDAPLTASYAVRNYITPLELEPEDLEGEFFDATIHMATWDGKLYNMPFENSSALMYINKDLFRAAGIEIPGSDIDDRLTWETVVEYAKAIQESQNTGASTEVWGLAMEGGSEPYRLLPIPQSMGAGSGVSPDGLSVDGYLNNAGWKRAMQWWYDVNNTWAIHPKGSSSSEATSLFANGRIGILVGGTWNIPTFEQAMKDGLDFAVLPHPYFEGGTSVTPTNSWHLAVNPYSNNKESALAFIEYMTSDETQEAWVNGTGQLASNMAMANAIRRNPLYEDFPWDSYRSIILYELENTAVSRPVTPFYSEWQDVVSKAFQDVSNGADPEEVLEGSVRTLERFAEKYR